MLIHFFSAPNGRSKEKCPTIKRAIVMKINSIQISKHCNCPNAVRNTTTFIKTALLDGPDVEHNAEAYRFEEHLLTPTTSVDLPLAAGGGCIVCITPRPNP